jgi:hypothetical protein
MQILRALQQCNAASLTRHIINTVTVHETEQQLNTAKG